MIPTPEGCEHDAIGETLGERGWWLHFTDPEYSYPIAFYVPQVGEYVPSTPETAPKPFVASTPTWAERAFMMTRRANSDLANLDGAPETG